jgi:hypothetical protein
MGAWVMTDAPEKLWVLPLWGTEYPQDCRVTYEKELFEDDSQEYIRKDIAKDQIDHAWLKVLEGGVALVSLTVKLVNAKARIAELEAVLAIAESAMHQHDTADYDYDQENPWTMGEWFELSDREAIAKARSSVPPENAALKETNK